MKIYNIQFYNYRGFYGGNNTENAYNLPINGNNVLIYGENGSGKSSIFNGLKDFFQSADEVIDFVKHNRWEDETNEAYVEITFNDGTEQIIRFNEKTTGEGINETRLSDNPSFLSASNKLKGFLSYKNILETHFKTPKDDDGSINLFSLIVENILKNHIDDAVDTSTTILQHWEVLKSELIVSEPDDLESDDPTPEEMSAITNYNNFKDYLDNFNTSLASTLMAIETKTNELLAFFDKDLTVKLFFNDIETDNEQLINQVITPQISYFDNDVINHEAILNEARLSALAISIYFASILTTPSDDNASKILFLDDIFIGLDTSNRIPLLKILKREFSDYQIFITTYDRYWFEVANRYLDKWQTFELYSQFFTDKETHQTFEIPVIITPSDDYITKAKKYELTKDYSASSNYLRKGLEQLIKERLPEEIKREYDKKPHALSYLWERLIERYQRLKTPIKVSEELKKAFKITSSVLLNPQSHDGLNFPVYEYELAEAFKVYNEIKKLPIVENIILLNKGAKLEFKHPSINYSLIFELYTDWRCDVRNGIISEEKPKCKIISFENDDGIINVSTDDKPIIDKWDKVLEMLREKVDSSITDKMILKNTYVNLNWVLADILNGYKQKNYSLWDRLIKFFDV
jgi:energy-coupling factor transporter ATP-binding protein EcfA2